jgi:hypothetical protein
MESPTTADLYRVDGTSGTDVWAAGEDGTVLHYDGDAWTIVEMPLQALLSGLSARAPDDVIVVGGTAGMAHFDGSTWSRVRFASAAHVLDDVLVEDRRVVVVGSHGLVELARTVPW